MAAPAQVLSRRVKFRFRFQNAQLVLWSSSFCHGSALLFRLFLAAAGPRSGLGARFLHSRVRLAPVPHQHAQNRPHSAARVVCDGRQPAVRPDPQASLEGGPSSGCRGDGQGLGLLLSARHQVRHNLRLLDRELQQETRGNRHHLLAIEGQVGANLQREPDLRLAPNQSQNHRQ